MVYLAYGHILGDELLNNIVETIAIQLPPHAIFARYGGEEFAVIVPNGSYEDLVILGNKIVKSVREANFEHLCQDCGIATISMGGYTISNNCNCANATQLVMEADKLLYLAKQQGGDIFIRKCADDLIDT